MDAGHRVCRASASFYESLRNQKPTRDTFLVNSKDVDEKLAGAPKVVKATYCYPYQMHGSIGTSCAVADVQAEKATIWSATQAVYPLRSTRGDAARAASRRTCTSIFTMGSGCYGLNGADTVSYDAALLSQAVGKPVRVQLIAQGRDGVGELRHRASSSTSARRSTPTATIVAWDYEAWSPALGGRPGTTTPGNVVTGFARRLRAGGVRAAITGARTRRRFANNSNAAPSYVTGASAAVAAAPARSPASAC